MKELRRKRGSETSPQDPQYEEVDRIKQNRVPSLSLPLGQSGRPPRKMDVGGCARSSSPLETASDSEVPLIRLELSCIEAPLTASDGADDDSYFDVSQLEKSMLSDTLNKTGETMETAQRGNLSKKGVASDPWSDLMLGTNSRRAISVQPLKQKGYVPFDPFDISTDECSPPGDPGPRRRQYLGKSESCRKTAAWNR